MRDHYYTCAGWWTFFLFPNTYVSRVLTFRNWFITGSSPHSKSLIPCLVKEVTCFQLYSIFPLFSMEDEVSSKFSQQQWFRDVIVMADLMNKFSIIISCLFSYVFLIECILSLVWCVLLYFKILFIICIMMIEIPSNALWHFISFFNNQLICIYFRCNIQVKWV